MTEIEDYLVPGRACGTCTACCKDLAIVEDGMDKLPGVLCAQCLPGAGCKIYADRPTVCRTYHCLWRRLPQLAEEWRPDLSDILIVPSQTTEARERAFAIDVILVGPPAILKTDRFASMVAGFIASGTITNLNIPTAPGYFAFQAELNEQVGPAIAARDLAAVKMLIWQCYETITALPRRHIDR